MDVTVIVAIASGITGLVVAVLTHIKHSECWGVKVDTTTSPVAEQGHTQQCGTTSIV